MFNNACNSKTKNRKIISHLLVTDRRKYVGSGSPSSPGDRRFQNPLFFWSASPKPRSLRPCTAQRLSTPPAERKTTNRIPQSAPPNRISILSPLAIFFSFFARVGPVVPNPKKFNILRKEHFSFCRGVQHPGLE